MGHQPEARCTASVGQGRVRHDEDMAEVSDFLQWLYTDEDVFVVQVAANDPRFSPTEWVVVGGPTRGITLADLESLPSSLRDECGWGVGYEEDLSKRGGGIGASGATILGLVLGVVGAVPTIQMLLERLRRDVPECPDRPDALDTATWAIVMQYVEVERQALQLKGEARDVDHWTFSLWLPATDDAFEVEVYGSRSGTVATRVAWTKGDLGGRQPGTSK